MAKANRNTVVSLKADVTEHNDLATLLDQIRTFDGKPLLEGARRRIGAVIESEIHCPADEDIDCQYDILSGGCGNLEEARKLVERIGLLSCTAGGLAGDIVGLHCSDPVLNACAIEEIFKTIRSAVAVLSQRLNQCESFEFSVEGFAVTEKFC